MFVQQVRAGKLKAFGVSSAQRSPIAPDIPTIAEQGLPSIEAYAWFGLLTPAGVSDAIVSRLNSEIMRALSRADVRNTLENGGLEPIAKTPQEYDTFLRAEIVKYAKVIKEANIKAD